MLDPSGHGFWGNVLYYGMGALGGLVGGYFAGPEGAYWGYNLGSLAGLYLGDRYLDKQNTLDTAIDIGVTIVTPDKYGIPPSESDTLENGIETAINLGISHLREPEKIPFPMCPLVKNTPPLARPID